jgi:16S rRNA (adenine1518-N6/adenine1519-N6)-dimethyltransferase
LTPPDPAEQAARALPPLREVIAKYGLAARKSLGQNFLLDGNLTRRIARAAGSIEGATVLEVGPGPGGLTRALLDEGAAKVIAVELDKRCVEALSELSDAYPGHLTIVEEDALRLDERTIFGDSSSVRVVANLPYNVATALLIKWLSADPWPAWYSSLTLMFQKEVADRICAAPSTKARGRLSIFSQWRTRPKVLFDVGPRAFVPSPKVTSSVVGFEILPQPVAPASLPALEAVTAAAFGQRRKMLRASLKTLHPDAPSWLLELGIDPELRPETLSVEQFCALARIFEARTGA